MKKIIPARKQSEFINSVVRTALKKIEKQQIATLAIEAIDNCPLIKSKKALLERSEMIEARELLTKNKYEKICCR